MARYFVHLHNDIEIRDEEGREFADLSSAKEMALDEARTMAARSVREGHLCLSHSVTLADERDGVLFVARFGDAVAIEA